MDRIRLIAVLSAGFSLLAAPAYAQEEVGAGYEQRVSFYDVSQTEWDGFYIGAQGGYAHVTGDDRFESNTGFDGGIGGIYGGYNYVYRNAFVGVEVEGNFANTNNTASSGLELSMNSMAAAKLRGGITYGFALAYANVGIATASITARNATLGTNSDNAQVVGWIIGGGAEAFVSKNLAIRLDYQHLAFSDEAYNIGSTRFQEDMSADIVRLGLTYRFETY
ncbi:outer membrane protein [Polycladidibacter hongkongensis]|uniref:outer membrane protein n=1 Tax=Polycladidibacter hongkongensis TaxID=1647556 RepID=UPI000835ECCB|nr:outer membrane beta-barrel protein [Pseudovibrio hongkongensis]